MCKPILVSSGVLEGKGVRSLLRPEPEENDMNTDELRVWKYLLCFIDNASEEGMYVTYIIILCYLTLEIFGWGKFWQSMQVKAIGEKIW